VVIDCTKPATPGSKVCDVVEHQQAKKIQGQSRFQLKERLKRAQFAHPGDPLPPIIIGAQAPPLAVADACHTATLNSNDESATLLDEPDLDPVDQNGEVHFELTANGNAIPATTDSATSTSRRKLQVQFGRKRTHNEQLFVAPCGVIVARETFFYSEAPSAVIVSA
jgi:hypothetical protein